MTSNLFSWRAKIFLMVLVVWGCLATWSVGAFWEHLTFIHASPPLFYGSLGGELILLMMIWLHCFYWKIQTRKWALIFSVIVGVLIICHAAALVGLHGAQSEQISAESRLTENLAKLNAAQIQKLQSTSEKQSTKNARLTKDAIREMNKSASASLLEFTRNSNQAVLSRTILPDWYANGGMFIVIFGLPSILFGILLYKAINDEDVDANFDGVVDKKPEEFPSEIEYPKY